MRVAVVLNGKAGALLGQSDANDTLRTALNEAGLQPEFIPDDAPLPERMQRAVASAPDAVLVAGGDGSVACAAQVLADTGIALGILPFGTMNLMAKDLSLPIGDVAAAVRTVAGGHRRGVDVGDVNGTTFLCASMIGLPAQLGRYRETSRGSTVRLWSRMARATLRLLSHYRRLRLTVGLDGAEQAIRAASLTVTVNPVDEACGRSFGRSVLDGGTLHLYAVDRLRLRDLLRLGVRLLLGRLRSDRGLTEHHAQQIDMAPREGADARAIQVMNDGELVLLRPPLRYRLRPRALTVLAPAP